LRNRVRVAVEDFLKRLRCPAPLDLFGVQESGFGAGHMFRHAEDGVARLVRGVENLAQAALSVFAELAAVSAVQRDFPRRFARAHSGDSVP
jgi:hypothetical protein